MKRKRAEEDINRRQWPRLKPEALPFLKSVTFNQGSEVHVIDISRGGVLLETEAPLRPQMKLTLKLVTTEGIVQIEGIILRSRIASLEGIPKYHSAISFIQPLHLLDDFSEETSEQAPEPPMEPGWLSAPDAANDQAPDPECGISQNDESAILTMIAQDGISIQEMFKLNDW